MTESRHPPTRPPLAVTFAVWKVLFLRDMLNRMSQDRLAWIWMIVEPVAHIAILAWLFSAGIRTRTIAGADSVVFIMLGILGFFMLRNIMTRGMDAVDSSSHLYAFRQIKPVDTVIVRALTAGYTEILIFIAIFAGAGLLDYPIAPARPLEALLALFSLWLLGLGLALALSVPATLVPEFGRMVRLLMMPLYFFSGVIFPVFMMPKFVRDYMMLNPILHGVESLRVAFMPTYVLTPGINLPYIYGWAVALILLGLVLHVRYRTQLMTK